MKHGTVKVRKVGGAIDFPTIAVTLPYSILAKSTIRRGDWLQITLETPTKIIMEKIDATVSPDTTNTEETA